jgi:hypothetical protein
MNDRPKINFINSEDINNLNNLLNFFSFLNEYTPIYSGYSEFCQEADINQKNCRNYSYLDNLSQRNNKQFR